MRKAVARRNNGNGHRKHQPTSNGQPMAKIASYSAMAIISQ